MIHKVWAAVQGAASKVFWYGKGLRDQWGWRNILIGIGALVLIFFGFSYFSNSPEETLVANTTPRVALRSVADLTAQTSGFTLSGNVTSKSEATVRAEKSGEIKSLNYQLGSFVAAGAIVASVENASERAAVLRAQAGVESAKASAASSGASLEGAKTSAVNALLTAYAATENAANVGGAPTLFTKLNISPTRYAMRVQSDSQGAKRKAEELRVTLDAILERQEQISNSISENIDLFSEISRAEEELLQARRMIDFAIEALNDGTADNVVSASEIDAYKTSALTARTSLISALAGLASARESLQSEAATNVGSTSVSAASVKQAEATLASARADLEHTLIRAPISGTINSLPIKLGDYVQNGAEVLVVANNNALEVITYITESDARALAVGNAALIDGRFSGTVTRIAPALDPLTKKIELRVGITDTNHTLLNGASVSVELTRTSLDTTLKEPLQAIIPLSAIKIGVETMVVFTVDADFRLVPHPVTLGLLLGERVEISEGLTPSMMIVVDARGLQAGEKVEVK